MEAKIEENSFGIIIDFGYGASINRTLFLKLVHLGFAKVPVKGQNKFRSSPPAHIYKEQLQAAENLVYDYNQGKFRKELLRPKSRQL